MRSKVDDDTVLSLIRRECFWDSRIDAPALRRIVASDDFRMKCKVFEKILHNATDKLRCLRVFRAEDLPALFDAHDSRYAEERMRDHVLALRNILLGENNRIERLQWKKR